MLPPGVRLGPYEILSLLGAGGMGEVYLAHDSRLDRQVALKVLTEEFSTDRSRIDRFEREARSASALNHPNIVTIYDIGSSGSVSWIAMEHVIGPTLRKLLADGPIPLRKMLPLAAQIADGLAAAHDAGLVHRDLKPENLIVGKSEFVKIVDFGLAKLRPGGSSDEGESLAGMKTGTFPGTVLGTVAYMAPEQARGLAADHRSDQFSFGSVLYEMATGNRPFRRETAVETMSAILREEPEPLARANPRIPVPLRWIIERCLAKEPSQRYASTHDLAHDLRGLRDHISEIAAGSTGTGIAAAPAPRARIVRWLVPAAVLAALGGVFLLGERFTERPVPDFQRLTFRRGGILGARFGPDGRTIVYSAAWDGGPLRLYATRTDANESTALGDAEADVAAISTLGEVAIIGRSFGEPLHFLEAGTLSRLPLTGGAPREMTEGVVSADWSPDGKTLAISRVLANGKRRVEFPIGRPLYESDNDLSGVRVSPSGDRIAFVETRLLTHASVETVDLSGKRQTISTGWKRCPALAWSPDGSEIWFTANERGWRTPLRAVKPGGAPRVVLRLPSWITVWDVAPDGRVLLSLLSMRATMRVAVGGETEERDVSWHEGSLVTALTPDGKTVLFDEGAEGYLHGIYVRPTDGSPAKRIGEGRSMAISADGRWVATNAKERGGEVVLVPTAAGESRVIESAGHQFDEAAFMPDGRLLLVASDPGHGAQTFVWEPDSGRLRPVGAEGLSCLAPSPDAREVACEGPGDQGTVVPIGGGASRPIPGFGPGDSLLQWSQDGRSLFVTHDVGNRVLRLDLATGQREIWRELKPPDRVALTNVRAVAIAPDGRSYAYSGLSMPSELYVVTGLR